METEALKDVFLVGVDIHLGLVPVKQGLESIRQVTRLSSVLHCLRVSLGCKEMALRSPVSKATIYAEEFGISPGLRCDVLE
jgi:hypothetical protein